MLNLRSPRANLDSAIAALPHERPNLCIRMKNFDYFAISQPAGELFYLTPVVSYFRARAAVGLTLRSYLSDI